MNDDRPRTARSYGPRRRRAGKWCLGLAATVCLVLAGAAQGHARPLETGFIDPAERAFAEEDRPGAYDAARAAGASVVRVPVVWGSVAWAAPQDATNPGDPAYQGWAEVDRRVRDIVAAGMEPLLSVYGTPEFARLRGHTPRAGDLGAFFTALAHRYAGTYRARDGSLLPRVRRFQVWNEPNLKRYLDPENAAADYRAMVQAAYAAVHDVHDTNLLVAGGLAPFSGPRNRYGVSPLPFMRAVLAEPVQFDAWSHHAYTSGQPDRRAVKRGDVMMGDLPQVRSLLSRTGHRRARLWVTEFSWDTAPPDPFAVPLGEHARWVAEGLYRMWRHGVSLVVWFQLRDNPRGTFSWAQTFQSGLYFRTTERYADERSKPALTAFRFPFAALPQRGGVRVWGRTPRSDRRRVVVERQTGRRWRRVATLTANRDGVFTRRLRGHAGARLRARIGRDRSLPFTARTTRKRRVNPFGGAALPPN